MHAEPVPEDSWPLLVSVTVDFIWRAICHVCIRDFPKRLISQRLKKTLLLFCKGTSLRKTSFCALFSGLKTGFINLGDVFVGMLLPLGGGGRRSCCVVSGSATMCWLTDGAGRQVDASTDSLGGGGGVVGGWRLGVHPGLLRVDAQAEKNEGHGESQNRSGDFWRIRTVYVTIERIHSSREDPVWGLGRTEGGTVRGGSNPEQHQTNAKHSAKIRRLWTGDGLLTSQLLWDWLRLSEKQLGWRDVKKKVALFFKVKCTSETSWVF